MAERPPKFNEYCFLCYGTCKLERKYRKLCYKRLMTVQLSAPDQGLHHRLPYQQHIYP